MLSFISPKTASRLFRLVTTHQATIKAALRLLYKFTLVFFGICALLTASGCANRERLIEHTSFNTKITNSGLKHFEIYLAKRVPNASTGKEQDEKDKVILSQKPASKSKRSPRHLKKIADIYIEDTQYCRTGYWIMEIDVYRPVPRLRGECNEAASDEDRKLFADSIQRW